MRFQRLDSEEKSLSEHIEKERAAAEALRSAIGAELSVVESLIRRSIIPTEIPYCFKISKVEPDSGAAPHARPALPRSLPKAGGFRKTGGRRWGEA